MSRPGGLVTQATFWQEEVDAPILKFNANCWLQGHTGEALQHTNKWLSNLRVARSTVDLDMDPVSGEGNRIFRADANRTFRSEPNRLLCIKLLSFAQTKFGDYQQSLGYVAGFMLLFLDPATVFKVLTVLNDHPKYLPGYWRGEATACAVDGYVALSLLKEPMRARLLQLGLLPETFVQKWFAGLCIHHLPYHLLFGFLDNFFEHGNAYLFQFFLAFFTEFEHDLMTAKSNPEANQLIRFESASEERLERVIAQAVEPQFRDVVCRLDLHILRVAAFEDNLSQRLQRANEGMWQKRDDEITFSDEED